MSDAIEISIVIPCLNESETIDACVREALQAIHEAGFPGEVIVADNGSTDNSVDIARKAGAKTVQILSKGYGSALLGGIAAAQGKFILMGDADGSYNFRDLSRFIVKLTEGYDLVVGCRFPKCGGRIESGAMPWKHRWIGNPVLSALGKLFFSSPVDDFHCGLRAFRRESILSLGLKTHGMEFASEMVVKATLKGLRIAQVPITLRKDGRSRPPHLRSWRDGWRHLRFMLLYSPLWLFMLPGLFLTIFGLIGFMLLRSAPVKVGFITFDLNSLLVSSTAMLAGFQVFGFGIFMKAYAVNSGLLPGKNFWFQVVKGRPVEWGICIGLLFALAGTGSLIQEVLTWKSAGFGALSYQSSLRAVITAVTGIGLGIQAMVYGFALAIIGLER
ncbi:MAG: glycosyltransferase family 2 protein [Desulfatirhabdiaceae bacterium]|nr:glycosyltransferase family 2 protein [Desulfatirhabdiaceae bacterium]